MYLKSAFEEFLIYNEMKRYLQIYASRQYITFLRTFYMFLCINNHRLSIIYYYYNVLCSFFAINRTLFFILFNYNPMTTMVETSIIGFVRDTLGKIGDIFNR